MPANGSHLPPELLRKILFFTALDNKGHPIHNVWNRSRTRLRAAEPRNLAACIPTCSDWAKQCRSLLFQSIHLRSAQDVHGLMSFVAVPPSARFNPVANFIVWIDVQLTISAAPWVHLLYPLLGLMGYKYNAFDRCYELVHDLPWVSDWAWPWRPSGWLTLDTTIIPPLGLEKQPPSMHTVHHGLPRSLPACYHALEKLAIKNVRFQSLKQVLRVTRELVALDDLELCDVAWEKGLDVTDLRDPVHFKRLRRTLRVEATGCTDDAALALLVSCETSPVSRYKDMAPMALADVEVIWQILHWTHSVLTITHGNIGMGVRRYVSPIGISLVSQLVATNQRDTYRSNAYTPKITYDTLRGDDYTGPLSMPTDPQHIHKIVLDLDEYTLDNVMHQDWVVFATHVLQFPMPPKVVIGFDSADDMNAFVEQHEEAVRLLRQNLNLELFFRDPAKPIHGSAGRYVGADPVTLERTGVECLLLTDYFFV